MSYEHDTKCVPCDVCGAKVVWDERVFREIVDQDGEDWEVLCCDDCAERLDRRCPKCNGDGWIDMDNDHGEPCPVCCKGDKLLGDF